MMWAASSVRVTIPIQRVGRWTWSQARLAI
jgi:hypothetical protein